MADVKISSDYVESFDRIIKAYSQIGECLTRFRALGSAFRDNLSFQYSLGVFYADILRFHKQAYTLFRRPCELRIITCTYILLIILGWKILFLSSWGRFQRRFDNILDDLKRHGELIDKEANALNISEAREARQKIDAWREESHANLDRYYQKQVTDQLQGIMTWLRWDDSDRLAIFDKLSTEGSKYPGTVSISFSLQSFTSRKRRQLLNGAIS